MIAIKVLTLNALVSCVVNAATVTVSAGFGATNGLLVTCNGVGLPNFYIAIGSYDGVTSTFTQFGLGIQDSGTVNGSFTSTGPASVNNQIIHLYVGVGNSVDFFAPHALFRTASNTLFPADVSSVLASSVATFSNFTNSILVSGSFFQVDNRTIEFCPEPSTALLGTLGAFGLIRRRRS